MAAILGSGGPGGARIRRTPALGPDNRPRRCPPTIRSRDRSPPRPRPVRPSRLPPVRGRARASSTRCSPTAPRAACRRPAIEERNIEDDDDLHRRYAFTIPVVAFGDRELELATSAGEAARVPRRGAGRRRGARRVSGDYTFLVAMAAGLISFLSPVRAAARPGLPRPAHGGGRRPRRQGGSPSRWAALRHAVAYVAGFGAVFTLLGRHGGVRRRRHRRLHPPAAGHRRRACWSSWASAWPGSSTSRSSSAPGGRWTPARRRASRR